MAAKGTVKDCDTDKVRRGKVIRLEDAVKEIQRAAGMPTDKQNGIFGSETARAVRGRFGDLTDSDNRASQFQSMDPNLRNAIETIEQRIGKGMFKQDLRNTCAADLVMPDGRALLSDIRLPLLRNDFMRSTTQPVETPVPSKPLHPEQVAEKPQTLSGNADMFRETGKETAVKAAPLTKDFFANTPGM